MVLLRAKVLKVWGLQSFVGASVFGNLWWDLFELVS